MHSTALRIFDNIEEKIGFLNFFAPRVQQIEEHYLIEIVLLAGVIHEKEVLYEEILDRVLVYDLGWLVNLYYISFWYFSLVWGNQHLFYHVYAWNFF